MSAIDTVEAPPSVWNRLKDDEGAIVSADYAAVFGAVVVLGVAMITYFKGQGTAWATTVMTYLKGGLTKITTASG